MANADGNGNVREQQSFGERADDPSSAAIARLGTIGPIPTPIPAGQGIGRLIVTRKLNEAVLLGNRVIVQVIALQAATVTLRIEAPRDVLVLRAELKVDPVGPSSKGSLGQP